MICSECGREMKKELTTFGYYWVCKKCGLGVGANEV